MKIALALASMSLLLAAAGPEPTKAVAPAAAGQSCCSGGSAVVSSAVAEVKVMAPVNGDAAALFEKMKTIVGTWSGKDDSGQDVKLTYSLTGAGSALQEIDSMHGGMMTFWTLDGERVLMTHYCAAGNQPRMSSASIKDGIAKFDFVDASGMKTKDDAHMHELTVKFTDDGKMEQSWTLFKGGKATMTEHMVLTREK